MFMNCNILFLTDFSESTASALAYAVAIAKKYKGTIHVANVVDSHLLDWSSVPDREFGSKKHEEALQNLREHAETRLMPLVNWVKAEGISVEYLVGIGDPSTQACALAETIGCAVIVMATDAYHSERQSRFWNGYEMVVRQSPVPVLTIKNPSPRSEDGVPKSIRFRRIMCPYDFSILSERGLRYAALLCQEFDATLVIVNAAELPMPSPDFAPSAKYAEERARLNLQQVCKVLDNIQTELVAQIGVPEQIVCQMAAESDIDLLVVTTHGKSDLYHTFFENVTEKILRRASCPVLTLRLRDQFIGEKRQEVAATCDVFREW